MDICEIDSLEKTFVLNVQSSCLLLVQIWGQLGSGIFFFNLPQVGKTFKANTEFKNYIF